MIKLEKMELNLEISKILDKYLPADGIGTEREKLRMNLSSDIISLISQIKGYKTPTIIGDCNTGIETAIAMAKESGSKVVIIGGGIDEEIPLNRIKKIDIPELKTLKSYNPVETRAERRARERNEKK